MREIEVVEVNIVEGGVEVFARVFEDGIQVGFGTDGTVDIERFRVLNPPVLVPDPNGDIIRQGTYVDDDGNEITQTRTLREDPEEALLQILDRVINTMKNKHGDENIVPGKRGNTTTPILSDSGDGYVGDFNASWATLRAQTSGSQVGHTDSIAGSRGPGAYYSGSTYKIYRSFFSFDTSAIGSDSIDGATFTLYAIQSTNSSGDQTYVVVEGSQASTSELVGADYDNLSFTALSDSVAINNATQADKVFTLNATGEALINGSGTTKLVITSVLDQSDTAPSDGSQESNALCAYSDYTGTTEDPVLTIEHTATASTFTPKVMFF